MGECVGVYTSVGVRKRQPEIDGCSSLASKNDYNSKINLKA